MQFRVQIVLWTAVLGITFQVANAQTEPNPAGNFPYSSIGLGDLVNPYFASNAGMGGIAAAYHDPEHLNLVNPASLGWLQTAVFESGVFAQYSALNSSSATSEVWSGNLNYLAIGFTMRNPINDALDQIVPDFAWGMSFSLMPYSNVDYNILTSSTVNYGDTLTTVSSNFLGDGGTYRLNWGNGVRYKNFSAGLNLGYVFGRLKNNQTTRLPDQVVYFFNEISDDINLNGLLWNIGVGYDYEFKTRNGFGEIVPSGKKISIGAYANSQTNINIVSDQLFKRVYSIASNAISLGERTDTLVNNLDVESDGTLPATVGIGVIYEEINKLRLGFDFVNTFWEDFELDVPSKSGDVLKNSYRLSIGAEYIPNILAYDSYLAKVRYRLGFIYERDPRTLNGEQLDRIALTAGFGFPIIKPRTATSYVNIAFEAGQFGIDSAIQEDYVRLTLGFTLNDNLWFFKRKFN